MGNDPRLIAGQIGPSPAPIVNVHGASHPWLSVVVMGMLTMQFLVLCLIAWKLISPPVSPEAARIASLEERIEEFTSNPSSSDVSREVLRGIVSQLNGGEELAERLERLENDTRLAKVQAHERVAFVEKQTADIASLTRDLKLTSSRLERERDRHTKTRDSLAVSKTEIANYKERIDELTGESSEAAAPGRLGLDLWSWIGIGAGAAAILLMVGFGAAFIMRHNEDEDLEFSEEESPEGTPRGE